METDTHRVSKEEMAILLFKVAKNLNEAGFNDSVGRLLMQIVNDLSKPIPPEEVTFLNEWCLRLENSHISEDKFEAFDLVSDLSQIAKRFVMAKTELPEGESDVA